VANQLAQSLQQDVASTNQEVEASDRALGVSLGLLGAPAAACLLASFLACFRSRRSRTAFSRLSFAIVVFFLELEAM
jgi:hypothetical protein